MKEHQQLGRATAEIRMRITFRRTGGLPAVARLWNRLVGPCLIRTPPGKPSPFALPVSGLDQFFFAAAAGSTTFAHRLTVAFPPPPGRAGFAPRAVFLPSQPRLPQPLVDGR